MQTKINIFNEDCLAAMKKMEDNLFALAIVDPPYFKECKAECFPGSEFSKIGVQRGSYRNNIKSWDVPTQEYFDELKRVSRDQIIWGINYFDIKYMGPGRIIFDKKNDQSSFSNCEIAYCSLHKGTRIFRYLWNGMCQENQRNREIRIHPTQKPVALYKWLLTNYATPGEYVLDTHLGSGSSAIACYDMGFDLYAYEIDKQYYDAARNRLNNHSKQAFFL